MSVRVKASAIQAPASRRQGRYFGMHEDQEMDEGEFMLGSRRLGGSVIRSTYLQVGETDVKMPLTNDLNFTNPLSYLYDLGPEH
jgi:hypothetical protein